MYVIPPSEQSTGSVLNPHQRGLPALYDLTQPLLSSSDNGDGSWWTSTFLKSSNGSNYLLISHAVLTAGAGCYRASLLDLDTLSVYKQFYEPVAGVLTSDSGLLKISIPNQYGFQAQDSSGLPAFRTWGKNEAFSFDVTFAPTSPILYNGGVGGFLWGPAITYQFSVPATLTTGTVQIGPSGDVLTIDTDNSFTWLDRQWGPGTPLTGNFTWFQLHFGATKLSIWATDSQIPYQRSRFATIRLEDGSLDLRPIEFVPDYSVPYASTRVPGLVYATAWNIKFLGPEGGQLRIVSGRKDQEIVGSVGLVSSYTGVVFASGTFQGKTVKGFGVTEIIDWTKIAVLAV